MTPLTLLPHPRRTGATLDGMAREITQRQLRNDSGEIMRELDGGETFLVTRNGTPVGELTPLPRRRLVPAALDLAAHRGDQVPAVLG